MKQGDEFPVSCIAAGLLRNPVFIGRFPDIWNFADLRTDTVLIRVKCAELLFTVQRREYDAFAEFFDCAGTRGAELETKHGPGYQTAPEKVHVSQN